MSIIIVGVGDEDFEKMIELQGENGLYDPEGNLAQREVAHFVPFNRFKGSPHLLAEHVLEGIPKELVEYKQLVGQKPSPPQPHLQL